MENGAFDSHASLGLVDAMGLLLVYTRLLRNLHWTASLPELRAQLNGSSILLNTNIVPLLQSSKYSDYHNDTLHVHK